MIIILKALLGWLILMLIGTNVLGMIVRSLTQSVKKPEIDEPILQDMVYKYQRGWNFMRLISVLIGVIYFYILFHFWNIGVVISAALIMFGRLPDLLKEIKTGEKFKFGSMQKNPWDIYTLIMFLIALPVLWYSLYIIK